MDEAVMVPTSMLDTIAGRGLEALSDDELDVWAAFVDGHIHGTFGPMTGNLVAGMANMSVGFERMRRGGDPVSPVLLALGQYLVRDVLASRQASLGKP